LPWITALSRLALLLLCAGLLRAEDTALRQVSLQLQWKHQFEFAGFYAAREKGFYRDVGLDVSIHELAEQSSPVEDVISGHRTFGLMDANLIREHLQGSPLSLLANYFKSSPLVIVSRADIRSPAELHGRRLMITGSDLQSLQIQAMFRHFDVREAQIDIVPHSFNTRDFIDGKVDAIALFLSSQIFDLVQSQIAYNVLDPGKYGLDFYDVNLFSSQAVALADTQMVRDFRDASNKGWAYALEHPDEIVNLILQHYNSQGKSREALLFEASMTRQIMQPDIYPIGSIDPDKLNRIGQKLTAEDQQTPPFDPAELIFSPVGATTPQASLFNQQALGLTPAEVDYLMEKGPIKMCIDPNWLPFERIDNQGRHVGMAADLLRLMQDRSGVKLSLVKTHTWAESITLAKARQCDIYSLAMSTPERLSYMNFTSPYLSFPFVIATRLDQVFVDSLDAVIDKPLAMVKGYAYTEILRDRYPNVHLVEVDNLRQGLELVRNREVFGMVDALAPLAYTLQQEGLVDIKIGGKFDDKWELGIGTRNDEPLLGSIMQKLVNSISELERRQAYNNWLSIVYEQGIDYRLVSQIAIAVALVLMLFFFWNRKLSNINRELEGATRMKSEFLANMSHEIRTPMTGIIGMSHLLQQTDLGAKQHHYVQTITGSAMSLLNIINDILDLSKIEAGKLKIEKICFDLHEVLDGASRAVIYDAEIKGLKISIQITEKLDQMYIGDPMRIGQVLLNLLSNAVKFTHRGSILLSVSPRPGSLLHFEVRDQGIGMSQSQQSRLFQSFSQADGSISRKYGGSGLGLSISRQLVELMGGTIQVESARGIGTTMSFTLPLAVYTEEPGVLSPVHYERQGAFLRHQLTSLKGSRILLAEDNPTTRELVLGLLEESGIRIDLAENGEEALECFRQSNYELILMDMQMPVMDGLKATEAIRAIDKQIPIIALSANAMSEHVAESRRAGMNAHLRKPIELSLFYQTLLRYITPKVEPAEQQPAEPTTAQKMPVLEYIDGSIGLVNFAGKQELYRKLLIDFANNNLNPDLEHMEKDVFWRYIHTVKGQSAYLGAMALHEIAKTLDQSKNRALQYDFQQELQRVVDEIRHILTPTEPLAPVEQQVIPRDALDNLLKRLAMATASRRPLRCEKILRELAAVKLPKDMDTFVRELEGLLLAYRYKEAEALLDKNGRRS
jgi:signal transduction histidine kinase/ABC-type nitrate/sulfonate/bicarbonate transport system substrate-binding protein/FixJ family two-component response regulator/HPt (histidine-containing phosphotransfer) domain-containing protein